MTRDDVITIVGEYAREHPSHIVLCFIGDDETKSNGSVVYGKPSEVVNAIFNLIANHKPVPNIILDNIDILKSIALEEHEHSS